MHVSEYLFVCLNNIIKPLKPIFYTSMATLSMRTLLYNCASSAIDCPELWTQQKKKYKIDTIKKSRKTNPDNKE